MLELLFSRRFRFTLSVTVKRFLKFKLDKNPIDGAEKQLRENKIAL
jgi:hypothetical protein